ncbi:MAG: FAD-dependent oxidoreductase [Haloferula sp.]
MVCVKTSQRIVIIGGVAGGASAAARARRHSEEAEITIIERGPDVSFANCGLPYHIGGEIEDRAELAVQTPESLRKLLALQVFTETEAIAVHPETQTVELRNLQSGELSSMVYDQLILSPGAAPVRPPLPGIESPRILTLRNLQDMDHIITAASAADSVAVIGAGFIGLEVAEQLVDLGKKVELIELQEQVLPQLDPEMTHPLVAALQARGVTVTLGDGISSFEEESGKLRAILASGRSIHSDLVILSIGVRPESRLAKEAGIKLGDRGHITVDQYQRTSAPSVYAVGDVCESPDPLAEGHTAIPLGGPANRQGRTAADHIFLGDDALPYPGSIGTSIVRVFDMAAGMAGLTEKRLRSLNRPFETVVVNGPSHASYFPGAETITLKLIWNPDDGKVLGAQASGKDGVDKRLDVIATAIRGNLTISDLVHLELAYAPPFGSAKDVINVAGFAATNMRRGLLKSVPALADAADQQIVDVRPSSVAQDQPVPGARNIPLGELRGRLDEIDRTQPVYTMCQMGKTSYFAARILANHGFNAISILGGAHHQLD